MRGVRRTSSPMDGAADRGANAGRDGRACGKREEGRSSASQAGGLGGEKGRRKGRGGPTVGVPRVMGAAWAPAVGERGSEKREARRAWTGPGRKRVGRAQMNSTVLDLFKLIQTSSN